MKQDLTLEICDPRNLQDLTLKISWLSLPAVVSTVCDWLRQGPENSPNQLGCFSGYGHLGNYYHVEFIDTTARYKSPNPPCLFSFISEANA